MVPLPTCSFTVFGWLAHDELSGALSACCSRLPSSMSFVQASSIFAQSSQLGRPLGTVPALSQGLLRLGPAGPFS